MKAKLSTIICLTLCLLLCSATALAADHSTTATIDLVFDGMTFTDSVQVKWNVKYPVPEGGVKWDGTEEFIGYANKNEWKIIDDEEFSYVEGQIVFMAQSGNHFNEVEQIAAKYGARIVGYIALTEDYVIELVGNKSLPATNEIISKLKTESLLRSHTVMLHYVSYEAASTIPSDPWNNASWDERSPDGENWNIESIRALSAWRYAPQMREMNIAIIDSMFDQNHNDIDYAAVLDLNERLEDSGLDYGNRSHGTHVAGTAIAIHNQIGISGVFPKGKAVAIGVLGNNVRGDSNGEVVWSSIWFDKKASITHALLRDAFIINRSMGYAKPLTPNQYETEHTRINNYFGDFFDELILVAGYDFVFINSAGNRSTDTKLCDWTPMIENEEFRRRLIIVGSYGENKRFSSSFSNWGDRVDIVAPGEKVYSCVPDSRYENYNESLGTSDHFWNGTSQAAPHVTGVAAMVWSVNPELTGPEVKDIILSHGEPITATTNGGVRFVYPSLDAYASIQDALGIGTITGKVEFNLIGLAGIEIEMKNNGAIATLVTDQNGFFTADLPVGTYTLCIDSKNYDPIQRSVQIISGKDAEELVVLEGNGGNVNVGNFTCTVLDKNTQNPLNANVKLIPTNNSGVINVEGIGISGVMNMELDVGSYDLIVSMDGYYSHTEIVTISEYADASIIIELEPTEAPEIKMSILTGAVTLNSNGISGIEVKVISGTSQVATLVTDQNGQFATDLAPGAYVLSIDAEGYVPVSKNTTVFVGKTTTENIELDDSMYATISYEEDNYQSWYEIILHNAIADTKHFKVTLTNGAVLFDTANGIRSNVVETANGFRFPLDDELCTGAVLNVDAYSGQTHIYDGEIVMSPGALWNGSRKKLPDTHSFGGYWDKNGFYHSSDY